MKNQKTNVISKSLSLAAVSLALCAVLSACGRQPGYDVGGTPADHKAWSVPQTWYMSPEDAPSNGALSGVTPSSSPEAEAPEDLGPQVDKIYEADGTALSQGLANASNAEAEMFAPSMGVHPADWVPWRLAYFMTDLGISVQGILGKLILKGNPTIMTNWRPQYPADPTSSVTTHPEESADIPSIPINEDTTSAQMVSEIDPVIDSIDSMGKIKNKELVKANLFRKAREFQQITRVVAHIQGLKWWVSRFRMDFSVELSGQVTPVFSAGGDVRVRLEWHRIQAAASPSPVSPLPLDSHPSKMTTSMAEFVQGMVDDLDQVSLKPITKRNFAPYLCRVGLGVSAGGDIGIAKATGTVLGQVYFSSDAPKPTVHAKHVNVKAPSTLQVVEVNPPESHLQYAQSNDVPYEVSGSKVKVAVYKINHKAFRKGLKRAIKLGGFFAKHASHAHVGHWKIYELRAMFDLSLSGSVNFVTVAGLASTELDFLNENF